VDGICCTIRAILGLFGFSVRRYESQSNPGDGAIDCRPMYKPRGFPRVTFFGQEIVDANMAPRSLPKQVDFYGLGTTVTIYMILERVGRCKKALV